MTGSSSECWIRTEGASRSSTFPLPVVRAGLRIAEAVGGASAFATWEEAELMEVPMVTGRGTEDAEVLGVKPRAMASVLGTSGA